MPATTTHIGFILQAQERTHRGLPVVLLYGRLMDGRTFLAREGRLRPRFWIRADEDARARALGLHVTSQQGCDLRGDPLYAIVARDSRALDADAARARSQGLGTFEADVRLPARLLMERGLRGAVSLEGVPRMASSAPHEPEARHVDVLFEDPVLTPAHWAPTLSVLSLDIETDPRTQALLSIALFGLGAAEVLLVAPREASLPPYARGFGSERALLAAFAQRVVELDPDVLTGWNVVDFDLRFLLTVAQRCGVVLELGRGAGALRVDASRYRFAPVRAHIPGRVVLDGLDLVRGAFLHFDEHNLDFVARAVLGEGKLLHGPGRYTELLRLHERDLAAFCRYNLRDAELVLGILEKLCLVELSVERSLLSGMTPDRVHASVASFELLYGAALYARGVVGPNRPPEDAPVEPTTGGHVLEPLPGLHKHVVSLDFKSLYPSLIRTFEIDPLGHARPGDDPIVAPNGAKLSRERGVLPTLLDELFAAREARKRAGDETASHAIKILMNSFYGVLGTPACRYHDPDLANAITTFGREVLLWTRDFVERAGYRVLYGDTDSLFALSGETTGEGAARVGADLARRVNEALRDHLRATYRVESRLELELDTVYMRLFLPLMRGRAEGARKRYAGLAYEAGETRVVFTGMEVVRRDWTPLAKTVQRGLYERLFADAPVAEYLTDVTRALREGALDDQLVYKKALRRELADYTANTPPHVVAARKMSTEPGRHVLYVMTLAGPEPAEERKHDFDREHYLEKQVRPVAEPVLALLGLRFEDLVGRTRQLTLL